LRPVHLPSNVITARDIPTTTLMAIVHSFRRARTAISEKPPAQ
jgi:hypothetical protein